MSTDDSWRRGFVEGYRSISPGVTPSVPARPAEYPASVTTEGLDGYYYRLGYEAGRAEAAA